MEPDSLYPAEWETHVVLKDGSTVEIRPIRSTDRAALAEFHGRQSRESIYFRYFRFRPELTDRELDYFTTVDYRDRMAFVAVLGSKLVAVARYETLSPPQAIDDPATGDAVAEPAEGEPSDRGRVAEVAFFVDDDHHGLGIATLMLEYLAAAGRDRGLVGFTATVLPENYRMLGVFRSAGFEVETRFDDGIIQVDLGIELTEETSTAIADRNWAATARSVARIIEPRTVAVIGASRTPGTIGYELASNIKRAFGLEAERRLFPINPNAAEIVGVPAFRSIGEATASLSARAPEATSGGSDDGPAAATVADDPTEPSASIDLAVIAVRASLVEDVVLECAASGVRGLVIISNGFSELDEAGAELEQRIVDVARNNGMRLIGPNAFGVVNTNDQVRLRALFHTVPTGTGHVALGSESGPLGAAVLDRLRSTGAGVSSFVGIGNRADVSVNDLLAYWGVDGNTAAVVLYVESFGNLRNFSTVASRTSTTKPIIAVGHSSADVNELLRQAGVIVVDQVSQLADQARLAATQPVARGRRVTIVANAASVARLAADACRRHGLEVVVPTSVADAASEDSILIGNLDSVSLMPSGDPAEYERLIVAATVSNQVDLILVALAPTSYLPPAELAALLDRVNRSVDKPIVAIGLVEPDLIRVDGLPMFAFPEEAAQVLARHAEYGRWRATRSDAVDPIPQLSADLASLDVLLGTDDEVTVTMTWPEMGPLLTLLNIPIAGFELAGDLVAAEQAAERLGYPVVVKAGGLSPRSLGESGGAAIDIHTNTALVASYRRMAERIGPPMQPAIVQRMVQTGTLLRIELIQDPSFGAMITVAAGGSERRAAEPVARRFLPFGASVAGELVAAAVDAELLPAVDDQAEQALVNIILSLVAAAGASDRLAMVSLNPVLVAGSATVPADATVVIRRNRTNLLAGLRHLP